MLILVLIIIFQALLTTLAFGIVQRRLLFEIIALRNQLGLYRRTDEKEKVKPKIRDRDRILWICLSKLWSGWQNGMRWFFNVLQSLSTVDSRRPPFILTTG